MAFALLGGLIGFSIEAKAEKLPIGWAECLAEPGPGRAEFCAIEIIRLCDQLGEWDSCILDITHQWLMYDINLREDESLRRERREGIRPESRLADHLAEPEELLQRVLETCDAGDSHCFLRFYVKSAYDRWHRHRRPVETE